MNGGAYRNMETHLPFIVQSPVCLIGNSKGEVTMTEDINKEVKSVNTEAPAEVKPDPVAELTKKVQAMEENFKREQQISSKKELENKELKAQLSNRDSDRDLMKILVASMAEQKGVTEDEMDETLRVRKPDLLAQFEELEKTREIKRSQDAYNARANAIFEEVKHLPEDDENRDFVFTALMAGLPDKAETRIKKLKETPKPEPKPSEEEIAEAARAHLEKEGQLTNDLPIPSGTGKVWDSAKIAELKKNAGTPKGLKELMEALPEIEAATKAGLLKV